MAALEYQNPFRTRFLVACGVGHGRPALRWMWRLVADILPCRKTPEGLEGSRKFRQIRDSIEAIGLIEPLTVTPAIQGSSQHLLLDGHIRLLALRDLGHNEAVVTAVTGCTFTPGHQGISPVEMDYEFQETLSPQSFREPLHCLVGDYPEVAERLGETGQALISFQRTANGVEVSVQKSTGFLRLDQASVTFVQLCTAHPTVLEKLSTGQVNQIKLTWKPSGAGK